MVCKDLNNNKPTTVLSYVERSLNHIDEFGENVKVFWKPDMTYIAIQTSKNYLLLYSILSYEQQSFEFNFPNPTHAVMAGPGEGKGPKTMLLKFRLTIRVDAGIICGTSLDDTLVIATCSPPAIQCISWNPQQANATQSSLLSKIDFFDSNDQLSYITYEKGLNIFVWLSTNGKAYLTQMKNNHSQKKGTTAISEHKTQWVGTCFHGKEDILAEDKATSVSINSTFSLIAVGTTGGTVYVYSVENYNAPPVFSHKLQLMSWKSSTGSVTSLAWTSDGHALSVGYESHGLAVWSVYGSMLCATNELDEIANEENLKDTYIKGIQYLFWGPGNYSLYVLAKCKADENIMYTLPFVKSALTSYLHSDNAKKGLLQMDDRMLMYNSSGDYQDESTTIDPAAVAWTHIQYPAMYIADNWPICYSSISSDGSYIAIAGKRGFAHYNTISSRWKLFGNQQQEQSFLVRGGMVWYKTILIVSCENVQQKTYEIRLYSRDNNLDHSQVLYTEPLSTMPVYMTLCGNFLLVYTTENIAIKFCKAGTSQKHQPISYISWRSIDSVISSNITLLIGGKLLILSSNDKTDESTEKEPSPIPFDTHIISDKTEYYWIGKKGIENLRTSLWIMNGKGLRVLTNFLLPEEFDITSNHYSESEPSTPTTPGHLSPGFDIGRPFLLGYHIDDEEDSLPSSEMRTRWKIDDFEGLKDQAIDMPLDFYPISILIEKGIIIGVEQSISYNALLGFALFKMSPKMHLFLHHIFRYLLQIDLEEDAVTFAKAYEKFTYFSHVLEILLHTVLEEEAGRNMTDGKKTEVALWDYLFSVVGKPKDLFEICLEEGRLHTATSYLIILQTMQPLTVAEQDTMRLLHKAMDEDNYELCKELVRFLSSIDNTGKALYEALQMIKSHIDNNTNDNQMDKMKAKDA
ncbi:hypothetical protein CU097_014770 [Rhizopus azygosporus]|uniref:RIC1 C-terminal alpha solenoid region domain-containing protein n=1 Tax=Rhizopus azygosporus TaxID=86630 RepID=A0A367K5S9_RHIAZ|nr:hypothetical protein CU097_014770 [Rhizopus azygosporus]